MKINVELDYSEAPENHHKRVRVQLRGTISSPSHPLKGQSIILPCFGGEEVRVDVIDSYYCLEDGHLAPCIDTCHSGVRIRCMDTPEDDLERISDEISHQLIPFAKENGFTVFQGPSVQSYQPQEGRPS